MSEAEPRPNEELHQLAAREYKYGFVTDIEPDTVAAGPRRGRRPPHLGQEGRARVAARVAPQGASARWLNDDASRRWANVDVPADRLPGRSATTRRRSRSRSSSSLDEVDPELLRDLREARHPARGAEAARRRRGRRGVRQRLGRHHLQGRSSPKQGIIFCSFSEAVQRAPRAGAEVPRLGRARTPTTSSPRSTRRSSPTAPSSTSRRACAARWSSRPTSASTPPNTGQFERTLIVAEEGAYVSYLEGCTAPMRDENQLHAAVVELVALDDAEIKYSTVQNWYPGDEDGKGGIYNFVTKRGACRGPALEDLLDPGRDRLGDHLEVPELHPAGRRLGRRVLLGGADQQPPAGRHRHQDDPHRQEHDEHDHLEGHLGRPRPEHLPRPGARSRKGATGARNYSPVRLAADRRPVRRAHLPVHRGARTRRRTVEHEATTSKIGEDQLFYCQPARHLGGGRGLDDRQRLLQGGASASCRWSSPSRRRSCSGVSLEGSVG